MESSDVKCWKAKAMITIEKLDLNSIKVNLMLDLLFL